MRTFDQSASSSSARISGSDVSEPWPISAAGDMIATVLSAAIVTHGPNVFSVAVWLVAEGGTRLMPNVKPAAPTMNPRRVMSVLRTMLVMASALPRRAFDRLDDPRIGAAATDVGAHVLHNLGARRLWIVRQQVGRTHDLPG